MGECICPWEATIKENQRKLSGNGNKGLEREVEELKTEIRHMNENYDTLTRSYKILANSLQDIDVKEKVKIDLRKKRHELIKSLGTVATIVFGVLGAIYLILDHL